MKTASELKKQINSMDDDSLRSLILSAAKVAGADEKKANTLASDIPALRRTIEQTDDAQLIRLLSAFGNGNRS